MGNNGLEGGEERKGFEGGLGTGQISGTRFPTSLNDIINQEGILKKVVKALESEGITADQLQEAVASGGCDELIEFIARAVAVALNDRGTGHASVASIEPVPVQPASTEPAPSLSLPTSPEFKTAEAHLEQFHTIVAKFREIINKIDENVLSEGERSVDNRPERFLFLSPENLVTLEEFKVLGDKLYGDDLRVVSEPGKVTKVRTVRPEGDDIVGSIKSSDDYKTGQIEIANDEEKAQQGIPGYRERVNYHYSESLGLLVLESHRF